MIEDATVDNLTFLAWRPRGGRARREVCFLGRPGTEARLVSKSRASLDVTPSGQTLMGKLAGHRVLTARRLRRTMAACHESNAARFRGSLTPCGVATLSQPSSSPSAGSGPSRWWLRGEHQIVGYDVLASAPAIWGFLALPAWKLVSMLLVSGTFAAACAYSARRQGRWLGTAGCWLLSAYSIPLLDLLRALGMPIEYTSFEPLLLTGISGAAMAALARDWPAAPVFGASVASHARMQSQGGRRPGLRRGLLLRYRGR